MAPTRDIDYKDDDGCSRVVDVTWGQELRSQKASWALWGMWGWTSLIYTGYIEGAPVWVRL